jgi:hypothetical protein
MKMELCRGALALGLLVGARGQPPAPTYIPQTKFASGQDVQPVFEGWLQNADGTFTMVFGYFNRNWEEELAIPAGPDNKLEPGDPDRGQPTNFLPRLQHFLRLGAEGSRLDDHGARQDGKGLRAAAAGGGDHRTNDYDPGRLESGRRRSQ